MLDQENRDKERRAAYDKLKKVVTELVTLSTTQWPAAAKDEEVYPWQYIHETWNTLKELGYSANQITTELTVYFNESVSINGLVVRTSFFTKLASERRKFTLKPQLLYPIVLNCLIHECYLAIYKIRTLESYSETTFEINLT